MLEENERLARLEEKVESILEVMVEIKPILEEHRVEVLLRKRRAEKLKTLGVLSTIGAGVASVIALFYDKVKL